MNCFAGWISPLSSEMEGAESEKETKMSNGVVDDHPLANENAINTIVDCK